jgi:hypothetical protein
MTDLREPDNFLSRIYLEKVRISVLLILVRAMAYTRYYACAEVRVNSRSAPETPWRSPVPHWLG